MRINQHPWVRPSWCRHNIYEFPSFHVCLDLSQPEHPMAAKIIATRNEKEAGTKKPTQLGAHNNGRPMTEAQRQKISETQKKRWAALRADRQYAS